MKTFRLKSSAFSLLEMLVSTTVFTIILVVAFSGIDQASNVWRASATKIEEFQDARTAFEIMTRNLSQASLNTYLDYDNPENPTDYRRRSDLQFVCGSAGVSPFPGTLGAGHAVFFQAPANYTKNADSYGGLEGMLNSCGYYVLFDSDAAFRPAFDIAPLRYRFRLMQLLVPAENNIVYSGGSEWFSGYLTESRPIADNVIALIICPQDPASTPQALSDNFSYNTAASYSGAQPVTSNQLPPVIQITMVTISENSARRFDNGSTPPSVITNALAKKFEQSDKYAYDLRLMQEDLAQHGIVCRIFSSSVSVRESRWTK